MKCPGYQQAAARCLQLLTLVFLFNVAELVPSAPNYSSSAACVVSDAALREQRMVWCASMVGWDCPWCQSPQNLSRLVHHDWPNQVTYFHGILVLLGSDTTCLNTTYAIDTAVWLNHVQSDVFLGECFA